MKIVTIVFLGILVSSCSAIFFVPGSNQTITPADYQQSYQDVYIPVRGNHDVVIHGWYLPVPHDRELKGAVYYLHGNSDTMGRYLPAVSWLPAAGYAVFMIDYRGYGKSTGKPKLPDVFADVAAGFQWLTDRAELQAKPIYALCQSLGASLCAHYFSTSHRDKQRISALVLDAPIYRYQDIARYYWAQQWYTRWLQWSAGWFVDRRFNPSKSIAQLSPTPLLVFHSTEDVIVPFAQGKALFEAANEPKKFVETRGRHIDTFSNPEYRKILENFLELPPHPLSLTIDHGFGLSDKTDRTKPVGSMPHQTAAPGE